MCMYNKCMIAITINIATVTNFYYTTSTTTTTTSTTSTANSNTVITNTNIINDDDCNVPILLLIRETQIKDR